MSIFSRKLTAALSAAGGPMAPVAQPVTAERAPRDMKKIALIVGLSLLSWLSTWTGMVELIAANLGSAMGVFNLIAIGCAVAMLQIMIVWLLDQIFSGINLTTKVLYLVGYLFLTLISVGFGFGFYWKVLESRSETTRSAETSITQVQSTFRATEARLEQLNQTLVTLTGLSTKKAEDERTRGNTCPNSRPGDGPRRALRDADAQRFSYAADFVKGHVGQIGKDIKTFDGHLTTILKPETTGAAQSVRATLLKEMGRNLDTAVTRLNAFRTDPQLREIRNQLAERADKTTFADSRGGTFACPDPQLQSALRGVVAAIDQLPTIEKPKILFNEGSEAVIEAFRRLTTSLFGALQLKLPPTPEQLRAMQVRAVQSVDSPSAQRPIDMELAGLGKRDYIPLGIALFVDFCLLLVSLGRPVNRFVAARAQMVEAEAGPQAEILGKFVEVHDHEWIRRHFEVFRHVIFDFMGDYYAAVPLGKRGAAADAPPTEYEQNALMLTNLFAGLEQGRIFQRSILLGIWPIGRLIRRKLRRQNSMFADAGAYRFYKFKDRAWPEMILGAVMGAARQHQADLDARREQQRRTWEAERGAEEAEAAARRAMADAKALRARSEAEAILARAEEERAQIEMQRLEAELRRQQIEARRDAIARGLAVERGAEAPNARRAPRSVGGSWSRILRGEGLSAAARQEPVMPGLRVGANEPAAAMQSATTELRVVAPETVAPGPAASVTAAAETVPSVTNWTHFELGATPERHAPGRTTATSATVRSLPGRAERPHSESESPSRHEAETVAPIEDAVRAREARAWEEAAPVVEADQQAALAGTEASPAPAVAGDERSQPRRLAFWARPAE